MRLPGGALRDGGAADRGDGVSDRRYPSGTGKSGGRPTDEARQRPRSRDAAAAAANKRIGLEALAPADLEILAALGSRVQLTRAPDPHRRIRNHLLPVR